MTHWIEIAEEVRDALAEGRSVVALESTLIAHGLPWPENLETARAAEAAVRAAGASAGAGAVPATIAVLGGRVRIGLSDGELEHLARPEAAVLKAGRRDLGIAVARGLDAATTVSATLYLARQHGLEVMATGGLGGVHRDASSTFDISTDLDELAQARGALVVCAGVKSILDVPATLEVLETWGVPVVGYGTNEFPAFLVASSGLPLEHCATTPDEAAALVRGHRALGLPGALVLAQPVPADDALDPVEFQAALDAALRDAHAQGISGKAVTPFLLTQIRAATGGRSLRANRALIVNNARLAGLVAVALQ